MRSIGRLYLQLKNDTFRPQLILISGSTGTGKSTFGMSLALAQGIDRCISTDTIREILRTTEQPAMMMANSSCSSSSSSSSSSSLNDEGVKNHEPRKIFTADDPLYRSSYSGTGDPVSQWKECCTVLDHSIHHLIRDCIDRGVSLILEGVHIVPSNQYIDLWQTNGGVAAGIVLNIKEEAKHLEAISHRGKMTRKGAEKKVAGFPRIRIIHEEMLRLGQQHNWLLIEQHIDYDPIRRINEVLEEKLVDLFHY